MYYSDIINDIYLYFFAKAYKDDDVFYCIEFAGRTLVKCDIHHNIYKVVTQIPKDFQLLDVKFCKVYCYKEHVYIVSPYSSYFLDYNIETQIISKHELGIECDDRCGVIISSFLHDGNMLYFLPLHGEYIVYYDSDNGEMKEYSEWKNTLKKSIKLMRLNSACIIDENIYVICATESRDIIIGISKVTGRVEIIHKPNCNHNLWGMCKEGFFSKKIWFLEYDDNILFLLRFNIETGKIEERYDISDTILMDNTKVHIYYTTNFVVVISNKNGRIVVVDIEKKKICHTIKREKPDYIGLYKDNKLIEYSIDDNTFKIFEFRYSNKFEIINHCNFCIKAENIEIDSTIKDNMLNFCFERAKNIENYETREISLSKYLEWIEKAENNYCI